ncbi:MAG TPA: alpha-amylase family protein [Candidatus Limnocylindrales bacterium]|nr:alpha-amylase family protein [Candidatus Limnocylindrales bacterium]
MTAIAAATADLWWKNAIIYCVDVDSFLDLDGDGVGDLPGLTQKIDYLAGIGVSCLWLQPFYPSPDRDNGYDITDYYGVDPRYGNLGHVVELIRSADERGMRVIADLVVNHTSVDHPWFQAAGDRNSPYHDYYVWADDRPANAEEGVIFPGSQDSIWSYDKRVDRWYMHRFYEHQPDLNINNPRVREEIHRIIGFWLGLGLSGFRVDAVPFMIEQEGSTQAATSDPHDYLRDLRAFVSRRRGDAILLAEANEPLDKLPLFFGDEHGDQMHMLFDFIGNQALYLALVRGDATPIARALRSRPAIPGTGQWANFVRNHDELSLDKLTNAQRQEVFAALAPEPDMRIFDRGIRRRLPAMVDGDRRRMELMYSLAFSLPGTPVLFYGEEIGMGDDQSLEGRNAVRTAMQWTSDSNAGFSMAPRDALPRPPVDKGPLGYRRVNVERQRERPGSFLSWFERLIRTRREWPEFGFGELNLPRTGDDAVLAHTLEWHNGQVLVIHNLAGRTARVDLALPRNGERGRWHHLLGGGKGARPPTTDGPRLQLDLGPYEYHWLGHREGP